MNNIDFEGLYNGKDHIYQSFLNEDKAFITKIYDYELHELRLH